MNPRRIKSITRVVSAFMLFALLAGLTPAAVLPAFAAPGDLTRVSVDSSGVQANGGSKRPAISDDGRFVAFASDASNLVSGDTNNTEDIFVKDRQTGVTTRVSVRSNGAEANGGSTSPAISGDGRFVAFYSEASNLLNGDTNGFADIFVHDRQTGETKRVSVDSSGVEANAPPPDDYAVVSISGDGRFVAYYSDASNLVSGDTNGVSDIFVYDRQNGRTTRASVASNGAEANGNSRYPNLSGDGRYVTFASSATNLAAGDTNSAKRMFSCVISRREVQPWSRSTQAERRLMGAETARTSQGMAATLYSCLLQVILIPEPMKRQTKNLSMCTTARPDRPRSLRSIQTGGSWK